jgi:hypothetical protein
MRENLTLAMDGKIYSLEDDTVSDDIKTQSEEKKQISTNYFYCYTVTSKGSVTMFVLFIITTRDKQRGYRYTSAGDKPINIFLVI